ncbi:thiol-disulfide isomerase/thioredoxin [Lewinella aquimaris]|uniref:Thiol-disulfide isomerase/thioredoxin n=1 Tax=Neolewinella aquimaris TaxID=1835722 RepID=A0A840E8D5_9BACT|nr:thioredoxin family protein [Neolewinella aquimaris]MBB4079567.1 thiol-disulfide isomerase/thioredoxin [Neolewinella aquimaris]
MYRILLLILVLSTTVAGQGIDFFQGSWPEALARAEAEDKLIFVDAYAEWCGPCKMMTANVFPDPEVGAYFNANFINVKFDMEKPESEEFREVHYAKAFPTLLFIDAKNEVVHRLVGARQSPQLLRDAAAALAQVDDVDKLKSAYEAKGTAEATYKYVRAFIRSGESHLRIANDHLRAADLDFTAPATLRLILISATEADSRIYDLLLEHRAAIAELEGAKAVNEQARRAVRATFEKALEYRDDKLMETAVDKLALVDRDESRRLASEGEFALALRGADRKVLVKATKNYLKKGADGDVERLRELFKNLENSSFIDYSEVIDLAVEAGTAAAELSSEGWKDYYRLARFLQTRQRLEQALQVAEKSLATLGEGPANYRRSIQGLIDELREATK